MSQLESGYSAKANNVLMLKWTFFNREKNLWEKLYTSTVSPDLEFSLQAWNTGKNLIYIYTL